MARWFIGNGGGDAGATTLYCFPHAGGSPGEYLRLFRSLPGVRVRALQLPGKAARVGERPRTRLPELVAELLDEVGFDEPFALFGHSFGGLLAYEVAAGLRARGRETPRQLVVSSAPAPENAGPHGGPAMHTLADEEFVAAAERRWGAWPEAVHSDANLLRITVRAMRADVAMFETYRHRPLPPLGCPITAVAGARERDALPTSAWGAHTSARFDEEVFEGGHFYFRDQPDKLGELVTNTLAPEAVSTGGQA